MTKKRFKSYWSETGTYEAIVPLIKMDFDGLKKAIVELLSGSSVGFLCGRFGYGLHSREQTHKRI